MRRIYIFSGLGVDKRIFQNIDFTGLDIIHVDWIAPKYKEPIEEYAKRLSQNIKTEKPIFIGLSLGGMMAIEISKFLDTEKIIIISSAQTKNGIPFYYRWAGTLKLHKLIPAWLLKTPNTFSNWFFGAKSKEEKKLLASILIDTDPVFLNWAIDKIVNWQNVEVPNNLTHIHGTADKVLPIRFVNASIRVKGGSHFMTVNKAEEITKYIRDAILV